MTADREKALRGWHEAKWLLEHPDMPHQVKVLAKTAKDHAEVVLGLQDALARAAARRVPAEAPAPGGAP